MCAINRTGHSGAVGESHPGGLSADGLPASLQLVSDVVMQVPGKASDEAQHVIRDAIRKQAAHIGQYGRVLDQFRKQVMLHAGRGGLNPAQAPGLVQHCGRDAAEECVGLGHLGQRGGLSKALTTCPPGIAARIFSSRSASTAGKTSSFMAYRPC